MKRVFGAFDLPAAHHARNLLETAGIRCTLRNEVLSSGAGELPPAECQIEVWVYNEREAASAERILRTGRAPGAELDTAWICHACGEPAEAQFTQCWRCGSTRQPDPANQPSR